jgi:Outer membrane protein beta-barrel domain
MRMPRVISMLGSLALAMYGLSAQAQWQIGLEGGPDINALKTNISNVAMTNYISVVSYNFGIPVQYKICNFLSVEADPSFVRKNYKLQWEGSLSDLYQTNKNGYIQLPLQGNLLFTNHRFELSLQGGAFAAYWRFGKVKGRLPDPTGTYSYDSAYVFRSSRDQRWDFGWLAGARLAYDAGKAGQWFIEGHYCFSLIDQQKNYEIGLIPQYNQTWIFSAGALFKLPHL